MYYKLTVLLNKKERKEDHDYIDDHIYVQSTYIMLYKKK